MSVGTLSGKVHVWSFYDKARRYAVVTLPFREASEYFLSFPYNAMTGRGEQRQIFDSHARKLKSEMAAGKFTPTAIGVSLRTAHQSKLEVNEGNFILKVDSEDPLPQTDGGHRFEAISSEIKDLEAKLAAASADAEKEQLQKWLDQVLDLPITAMVYLDGDPKSDFLNLQSGRKVDASHLLSLKVQQRVFEDPAVKLAWDTAKVLAKAEGSPYKDQIRLDSRGSLSLPISTLCSRGSSDIATSLIGLARVGLGAPKAKDANWLAQVVIQAYKALNEKAPELLEFGKILTPIANSGTRGSATMLIGLACCLAYRLIVNESAEASDEDLTHLVDSAKKALDDQVSGNFSGPAKRQLMRGFAREFFADTPADQAHAGLPTALLRTLSASTFAVESLPRQPRQQKPKATTKKKNKPDLPDVDGPLPPAKDSESEAKANTTLPENTETAGTEEEPQQVSNEPVQVPKTVDPSEDTDGDEVPWEQQAEVELQA